jgi:hypothetical protein
MVLILPKVKSFGERAGEALGGGFQQGIGSAMKFAQEVQLEKAKRAAASPLGIQDQEGNLKSFEEYSEAEKAKLAETAPKAFKALKESSEKKELKKGIGDTLSWLDQNISFSGKFGISPKYGGIEAQGESGGLGLINPKTGKQMSDQEIKAVREEIDKSGIWAADNVYTHFNKGVLNKDKWNDVKESFAPRSDLPASVNRARIAAMKRIMGLPENAPSEIVDKMINKELGSLEKIEKSKGVEGTEKKRPPLESFFE